MLIWLGDVKDRRSCSGIAVWVKGSVENTWYPVYASSKKQNMVCLRSGESELMALVGGACMGIYNVRPMEQDVQLLTWDDCFMHGQRSGSGIRETQGCGVDALATSILLQASALEPGQRILKVHGDCQQVADYLTKSGSS